MFQTSIDTPIGRLAILADDATLTAIRVGAPAGDADDLARSAVLRAAADQLNAYFSNDLKQFDLPLAPLSSPRGAAHRAAITAIDHGAVASYGEIARRIGSGPRAVGQACRRNPFPIVVPCHRVIGAADAIGHYSAGEGVATKRWLLRHENRGDGRWAI